MRIAAVHERTAGADDHTKIGQVLAMLDIDRSRRGVDSRHGAAMAGDRLPNGGALDLIGDPVGIDNSAAARRRA